MTRVFPVALPDHQLEQASRWGGMRGGEGRTDQGGGEAGWRVAGRLQETVDLMGMESTRIPSMHGLPHFSPWNCASEIAGASLRKPFVQQEH